MQIYGPSHVHGAHHVTAPHAARAASQPTSSGTPTGGDKLEISPAAQLVSQLSDVPDIRADRVAEIRAAIADGTYETDEKLGQALENFAAENGLDLVS